MNNDEVKNDVTMGDNGETVSNNHIYLQQVAHSQEGNIIPNPSEQVIEENNVSIDNTGQISNTGQINNLNSSPDNKKKFLTDSEMLYAFIGNNYQKFIMGKFNFSAFFLSIIYLLYRKMHFYSFIVMVLYIISIIFVKNTLYLSGITLTINFILGLCTNKMYLAHCRNKIDNIRYKHTFLENEELLQKCKEKGGTSIINVIVGIVVNVIIIILAISLYLYFVVKTPISDIYNKIMDYIVNNGILK